MGFYEQVARPLAFRVDPERMHGLAIRGTALLGKLPAIPRALRAHYTVQDPRLVSEVAGIRFDNPVGLAAGYDKNGTAITGLAAFGFGFIEIGSVSAEFSTGNPKPRLFRLPEQNGIVVHYGLPNLGAQAVNGSSPRDDGRLSLQWQRRGV